MSWVSLAQEPQAASDQGIGPGSHVGLQDSRTKEPLQTPQGNRTQEPPQQTPPGSPEPKQIRRHTRTTESLRTPEGARNQEPPQQTPPGSRELKQIRSHIQ